MRQILDKLIAKVDRKLTEARTANPNKQKLVGAFTFGRVVVRYVFDRKGCELEIWNPALDYFLDNVALYCESRVIPWDDIEVEYEEDEWNEHGFRNEQDYIKWRYN